MKSEIPEQEWSPRASGIQIKDGAFLKLESLWAKLIGFDNDMLNFLKTKSDIKPDDHDGSYELVRETIKSYSNLPNLKSVNFNDLDLIYLMSVIFNNTKRNEELIEKSSLPSSEKMRLFEILKRVWAKAVNHEYQNIEKEPVSVGMFGTGFYTFDKETADKDLPNKIIGALTEISSIEDNDVIYDTLLSNLPSIPKGIGIPSFSIVLHCLKPNAFPIFNRNQGYEDIYEILIPGLKRKNTLENYIEWCRKLEALKKKEFDFNNYRVIDLAQTFLNKKDSNFTYNGKNVFTVFQRAQTGQFKEESSGSYIQAPNVGKNNKQIPWHWKTVTEIKEKAFGYCLSMKTVTLPDNVEIIGKLAFWSNTSLQTINIPSTVTEIGEQAFQYDKQLGNITLPEGLTKIGSQAFQQCHSFTSINLPSTLKYIGTDGFQNCIGITKVTFPTSLEYLGSGAFDSCSSLTTVVLPEGLERIESYTFNYCRQLKNITFPSTLKYIGVSAFASSDALVSVDLSGTAIEEIDQGAFSYCGSLNSLSLPAVTPIIADDAFANTQVTLP